MSYFFKRYADKRKIMISAANEKTGSQLHFAADRRKEMYDINRLREDMKG